MEKRRTRERVRPYNKSRYFNLEKNRERPAAAPNGEFRPHERNQNAFKTTRLIGFRTLENVLKIDVDAELILKLLSEKNGFLLLLDQQNIRTDFMCLILSALARASESSAEKNTLHLLGLFFKKIILKLNDGENFYRELKLYIADLSNHLDTCSPHRQKHVDAVHNLLKFLRQLQLSIYEESFNAVHDLVRLISVQIDFMNRNGNLLDEFIVGKLAELNESIGNFAQTRDETEKTEALMQPPDDFRTVSIYPDASDILSNHVPFIRGNIVEGKYVAGVNHYLDVQFRLMREDFIRPLRDGITEYIHIINERKQTTTSKLRIKDLNVYQDVRVIKSDFSHNELVYTCEFDRNPFRNVRWKCTKRLMPGSLVCLSPDKFRTFYFGTIAGERNPEKLAEGMFEMKFEIENTAIPEISRSKRYTVFESPVYFEAYRHNLKVLQEFKEDNFPLEKYIVKVNKDISPPSYLTEHSVYQITNGLPESHPERKVSTVKLLSTEQWPPCTDFRLDESQFEAYRAALTKQMVIIQGPPGTGKTYIGLRIVHALLSNSAQTPILVVCYTNHALDQFLVEIQRFCHGNKLIRIGGKSQCAALKDCNLASMRSKNRLNREVPSSIHHNRMENKDQLKRIKGQIACLENNIERLHTTVMGDELVEVIQSCNKQHYTQLVHFARGGNFRDRILNWLEDGVNKSTLLDTYDEDEVFEVRDDNNTYYASTRDAFYEPELDEDEIKEMERERMIDITSDEEEDEVPTNQKQNKDFLPLSIKRQWVMSHFQREIKKSETMSQMQAAATDINMFFPDERWKLYRLWISLYSKDLEMRIKALREEYKDELLKCDFLRNQEDVEIAKNAKIIGMTTTGAAKYRHIIDGVKPKITIVEEAAEVLEAHIVTALCKETDHLILIGDHLQLRPNPAVYELAKRFHLDISLFERLIKNQMEYFQLKQQHRMRPCISSLLVPHIYKELLDHPSVEKYENVKGISKNMYFINHRQNESSIQETRSHINLHEAKFIVELCRYVILQGYDTSQVTILTTYSGQLQQIRQLMRGQKLLSDVRAAVVDNYQGEENDIILLSFVRSNEEGKIGFLKTSNRVNVALSRAREGLYCIGNFDCLTKESQLWRDLIADLTAQNAIGEALEIYCQNHTDHKNLVKSKNDFKVTREGGCFLPCNFRKPCGHSCPRDCHIVDLEHLGIYKDCPEKCDRVTCDANHRCPRKCHYGEECGRCTIKVLKLRSECQHTVQIPCWQDPSEVFCEAPCEENRSCGHKCKDVCGKICDKVFCKQQVQATSPCDHRSQVTIDCSNSKSESELLKKCPELCGVVCERGHICQAKCHYPQPCRCAVKVEKLRTECQHTIQLLCSENPSAAVCVYKVKAKSPCGHSVTVHCADSKKDSKLLSACTQPCSVKLKCGHLCKGSCVQCSYGRLHISCTEKCTRTLICGHPCRDVCSTECSPCKQPCTNSCVHSKCSHRCGDPCRPCMEKCEWRCKHLQCTRLCSEPCDRKICQFPNTRTLTKCGHQSVGVCGEKSPRLCKVCDKSKMKKMFADSKPGKDARFIELQDCKHVIEFNEMIQWMKSEPNSTASDSESNNQNCIQIKREPQDHEQDIEFNETIQRMKSEPNSAASSSDSNNRNCIQIKGCPKCKTTIRHTTSLNAFIKASLRDIEQVKSKTCENPEDNETTQQELNEKVRNILDSDCSRVNTVELRPIYSHLHRKTETNQQRVPKRKQTLIELSHRFELVETLREICVAFESRRKSQQNVRTTFSEKFKDRVRMAAAFIRDYRNCDQQRDDISIEISFLQLMGDAIVNTCVQSINRADRKSLDAAFKLANKPGRATESVRKEFVRLVTETCKQLPEPGISLKEKQIVLRYMSFRQNQWFKCPNGHVYCIGECGSATDGMECPECQLLADEGIDDHAVPEFEGSLANDEMEWSS